MLKYVVIATVALVVGALAWAANPVAEDEPARAAPAFTFNLQVSCVDPNSNEVGVSVDAAFKPGVRTVQLILLRGNPGPVADSEMPLNLSTRGRLPKTYSGTAIMLQDEFGDSDMYRVMAQLHGRHNIVASFDSGGFSC